MRFLGVGGLICIIISNMSHKQRVLIVGGGFGGVKAALELVDDDRFEVTLLSDDVDLRYYPTLYHTATGGRRANSSIPLSRIFKDKDIKLVQDTAVGLERKSKLLIAGSGHTYDYDSLIIGLGVVTNYFGIEGMKEYSYSIKSQAEVSKFKAHLHQQLLDTKRPDNHYVVVGAGPTGIELAGSLPGYLQHIMKNHGLAERDIHVDLIEAAPRLLPRLPKETSRIVGRRLKKLGVRLYIGKAVQAASDDQLMVSGKPIRSHTVIWTAGVTNHPFFVDNKFVIMGRGKVAVDVYLQTEENIYVIGDNANTPYSGLAQTALRDGSLVANNLRRKASGKKLKSYNAVAPITVIPAGPYWAAVIWGKVSIHGWLGWAIREAADFIGFRDLEPWARASKQFMSEFAVEDDCPVCLTAQAR